MATDSRTTATRVNVCLKALRPDEADRMSAVGFMLKYTKEKARANGTNVAIDSTETTVMSRLRTQLLSSMSAISRSLVHDTGTSTT